MCFYFVEIEYKVQLANVSKIFIQYFNKCVNKFQDDEFVFVLVDDSDEVETGVSLIDNFVLFIF